MNARMPGYTGFIPSSRAEDVCARTQAAVGRAARDAQLWRRRPDFVKAEPPPEVRTPKKVLDFQGSGFDDDHPLGRSKSSITRNHWVPTIPGYSGFIPAKDAESCIGGGMTKTCRLAGRAIAERKPGGDVIPDAPLVQYGGGNCVRAALGDENGVSEERSRLVDHLRGHCGGKIPGYMGFIPRVRGESIFGAKATDINKMAADYCEDRAFNPTDHGKKCCAPQFPEPRKLRM